MLQSRVSVSVRSAGVASVVGDYVQREASISTPAGFAKVCEQMGWPTGEMWKKLADHSLPWFEAPNGSYMYRNLDDGQWWIDEPSGGGVYVVRSEAPLPPLTGWKLLPVVSLPTCRSTSSSKWGNAAFLLLCLTHRAGATVIVK